MAKYFPIILTIAFFLCAFALATAQDEESTPASEDAGDAGAGGDAGGDSDASAEVQEDAADDSAKDEEEGAATTPAFGIVVGPNVQMIIVMLTTATIAWYSTAR